MTIIDKPNTIGGQGGSSSQEHGAGVGIMAGQMMQEAAGKAIPAGYKQTELGVIPEDWDVLPLNKVANFKNGVAHEDCVCESGKYVLVNSKFISSEGLSEKMSRDCRQPAVENDILMVMSDVPNGKAIAKCYLVNASGRYTVNQRICILSSQLVNSKYLFYKLNRNPFYLSFDDGAKQTNLRRQDVLDCLLAIPAEAEQTAIANVLSDSDALIDALEQLIAKKQAIKSATMQQLLTGRTRLPAFALRPDGTKKGYKPSELGEIPDDWEVVELGSCIKLVVDNRGKTPPLSTNGFPMLEVNAVYKQGRSPNLEKVTKYVSKTTFENWFRDGHPIAGDILVVTVGSAGETSFVNAEGYCIAQNLIGLRLRNNFDKGFIYYLTTFFPFKKQVDAVLMGAVQPSLKVPHLKKFRLLIPLEKKEQTAIATILSDMDNELQTLTQKLEKARALKQGMMQQLLTGKIRLPLATGA